MSIDNIEDYILQYQIYKKGNYTYKTLTSTVDVKNAIERGKKIVFIKERADSIMLIISGSIFLTLGLILGIVLSIIYIDAWIITFTISMSMGGSTSLYFLIKGFQEIGTSFIVLGPQGIVYKLPKGAILGYRWESINIDFFSFHSTSRMFRIMKIDDRESLEINIIMPNGDFMKVSPGTYSSKEFHLPITQSSPKNYHALFNFTFKAYYYYGKQESIDIQKTNNLHTQPRKVKGNYLNVLKEEYQKYKQKKYRFGMYGTRDQIRDEYLNGKIFVLKGGLRIGDWGFIIFFIVIGLFMFLMMILMSLELLWFGFFLICFWSFWAIILLLKLRIFLIISTIGVYYHRIISKGFFLWKKVVDLDAVRRTYRGITTTIVTLYLNNNKKKKFASRPFLIKEFPKEMEMEMFLNLFKIAFNLRKNPES